MNQKSGSSSVSISGLGHRVGAFTLSIAELTLPQGCVIGLVGPNGAGKTTLLDLLIGLSAPTSGTVRVLGLDPMADCEALRQRAGYMCDDMPLYDVPISKLLAMLAGYYPRWDAALVDRLMQRFGLDPTKRPGELSKGQGSRLRTLLAVAHRPELVLLDEPATGLDLGGRRALLTTLLEVVGEGDRTVIVSSHQLEDLERIADHVVVMAAGAIVRQGPMDALVGAGRTLEETLLAEGAA